MSDTLVYTLIRAVMHVSRVVVCLLEAAKSFLRVLPDRHRICHTHSAYW